MAARRKLISLCMIVKDDEQGLARCLRSAQGVVDEAIVVVDSSSIDGSADVARRFGAKVIERAWTGDFAAARNAGLDAAQGEWILILDADEELSEGASASLRKLALHGEEAAGWLLPVWNLLGNDEEDGVTINPVLRLFRNAPLHRFEGRIHEQIAVSILRANPNARLALGETVIRHYGYQPSVVAERDKIRRNMLLLLQAVEEEPDDPFHRYNLGVEFLRAGRPQDALESFREARRTPSFTQLSYAHLVFKYEARSLQTLGRWKEAAEAAEEGVRLYSDYADLWHTLAESLSRIGRRRSAIMAACYALRLGQPKGIYHTEDGMGTHRTAYLLGILYETAGSYDAAAHWYSETLRMKPSLMPPLHRLCRMFRVVDRGSELPVLLERRFTVSTEEAGVKIASVLLDSGCTAEAVAWLRRRAIEPAWGAASTAWLALAEASHAAAEGCFADARRRAERMLAAAGAAISSAEEAGAYSAAAAYERLVSLLQWLGVVEKRSVVAEGAASYTSGAVAVDDAAGFGLAPVMAGIVSKRDTGMLEQVLRNALTSVADGCDATAQYGTAALMTHADQHMREVERLLTVRSASSASKQVLRSARLLLAGCERGD
ncbi:glycosyltransferase involved in cell wall biosynthesis [Paenibacillus cellulosilyticus]|uniref:Glycosyltransferase involved in cell wall biosynthesis n=1 Tax=Paenibacillus cellulosilyticus TaxID=375489 RepID=A0A2V2YZG6_9BACL|nr:glycosyltransferase family 2 protein [Paenibacillus cellulosilyticus]PWW08499.1 glycosyltransferase involved in cell wall biosynthesis [Paenibacillus cellulosilyticus]QKS48081.1 glycosyltransferase family 2 protein [Paenibacillus cellulosilyticus]